MPLGKKSEANHALCGNLLRFTKGKAKGRVCQTRSSFRSRLAGNEQNDKSPTKMNILLKKADVLRPKKADTVNEIEKRLNDWEEKQR